MRRSEAALAASCGAIVQLTRAKTSMQDKDLACEYRTRLFVCLLQDASGHSNVLKAGKAEELKSARKRRTARKAN